MDKLIELIDNTRKTAFGSADFRIISFNDILQRLKNSKRCSSLIGRTVLPFAANSCAEQLREIMNTDIIKKPFERIKHHGTSR